MDLKQAADFVKRTEQEAISLHPAKTIGTYYSRASYVARVLAQLLADVGTDLAPEVRKYIAHQLELARNTGD